jgi:hypothetical protein
MGRVGNKKDGKLSGTMEITVECHVSTSEWRKKRGHTTQLSRSRLGGLAGC